MPRSIRILTASVLALALAAGPADAKPRAASKVSVSSPQSAVAGATIVVAGSTDAPRATGVVIQRAQGRTWRRLAGGEVRRKRFAVRVELGPSVQVGALRFRVLARRGPRTLARSRTLTVTVRPPVVPGASASTPLTDEGGRGSLGGDYPDADAVDCSAPPPRGFGIYSWCKNGTWLSPRGYGYRNCVDYAAWVLGLPRGLGDAKDWKANASKGRLTVTASASVGDVAWWGGGSFGHVAVVTAVYPSGAVDTVDYNGDGHGNKTFRAQTRADAYLHPGRPPVITITPGGGTTGGGTSGGGGSAGNPGSPNTPNGNGWEAAFTANDNSLWAVGADNHGALQLGIAPGTSPSITGLSSGGWEAAFQANDNSLWVVGKDNHGAMSLGMKPGTSPSITAMPGGGWEVAFQANDGRLWAVGQDNHGALNLGMAPGTSPSITALATGGWEAAFQANDNSLWVVGADNHGAMNLGMKPGTSPSITAMPGGGWEVAFQANDGSLWVVGKDNHGAMQLGMAPGTNPSITALSTGGWEVAFQANDNSLWVVGADNHGAMNLGMKPGTSPSITAMPGGGWEVAFQANDGRLWAVGADNHGALDLGMAAGTSPSITRYVGP